MNMNVLLYATASAPTEQVLTMSERLAYAGRMLVVGLGMVFAVLAILWLVLEISRVLLTKAPEKKEQAPKKPAAAPAPVQPAPVAAPTTDGTLIAVITAAIAASMEEQGGVPCGGFRVVSFRPAGGNRGWNNK